ncbi:undecaprenyldiphospho-muramoylpentapeptide beta-N-acetylglucosaminyltransferase [Patescibacteria group bacterium]
MRIVLTGGGTGGHIFPLVAVARKFKEKIGPESEFLFVGSKGKLEGSIMAEENIPVKYVLSGKARRYFSFQNFVDFFKIPIGVIQSMWILLAYMPDAIFSKGGYASIPVVIAAWIYRIPVMTHESDAVPGVTNLILGKLSTRIAVAYPTVKEYFLKSKVLLTGNPVREDIFGGNAEEARKKLGLTESKPTILVMGGSQGAKIINDAIIHILPKLLHRSQIIHQTGEKNFEEVSHAAAQKGIKVGREGYIATPFLNTEEMKDALAVADLVISRAGAGSISNIAGAGKVAILIPISTAANDHQNMNAYELAKIGGALVLEESNLGESMLIEKIENLLDNQELKSKMIERIRNFYHPDAADKIVDGIVDLIS